MLLGQTAINFAANVFSAAFGLVNVVIFTRLFAPAEFGIYVLGAGFAAIRSTVDLNRKPMWATLAKYLSS